MATATDANNSIGDWQLEKPARNVLVFRGTFPTAEHEFPPLLLAGDAHWDNPDCDRERLAKDFADAKDKGSPILIGGDFFCAMQGKFDKRSDKKKLLPEHATGNYLDRLVETAAEWLEPYADNIAIVCRGNHETSIANHHETDLTDRLCAELRRMGSPAVSGGYAGWVRFQMHYGTIRGSLRMYYHHGFGGGGPVTQGKIDFNRYQIQAEYDAAWSQHVHHTEIFDTRCAFLNDANKIGHKQKWHIRTPSYKDEYRDGYGGFQVERGQGPRPKGGVWLSVYFTKSSRFAFHAERTRE